MAFSSIFGVEQEKKEIFYDEISKVREELKLTPAENLVYDRQVKFFSDYQFENTIWTWKGFRRLEADVRMDTRIMLKFNMAGYCIGLPQTPKRLFRWMKAISMLVRKYNDRFGMDFIISKAIEQVIVYAGHIFFDSSIQEKKRQYRLCETEYSLAPDDHKRSVSTFKRNMASLALSVRKKKEVIWNMWDEIDPKEFQDGIGNLTIWLPRETVEDTLQLLTYN